MNKRIGSEQTQSEPELYTLLEAVRFAFRRYKSQLEYVKKSNFWKDKPYLWGRTHISILKHVIYWNIIKR